MALLISARDLYKANEADATETSRQIMSCFYKISDLLLADREIRDNLLQNYQSTILKRDNNLLRCMRTSLFCDYCSSSVLEMTNYQVSACQDCAFMHCCNKDCFELVKHKHLPKCSKFGFETCNGPPEEWVRYKFGSVTGNIIWMLDHLVDKEEEESDSDDS